MADHSKPTTASTYANYTAELDGRLDDLAVGLDPAVTTATVVPTNSIRWTSATARWQKYNGTSWADLSTAYQIAITGNAGTATTLQTARTINTVSFNGSANVVVEPYVEQDLATAATRYLTFVDSSTAGHQRLNLDTDLSYNPNTNTLTVANLAGNATTATSATTAGSATTATTATNATNVAVTDDTTTNATYYPALVTANSGNLPHKVSSTKLTFNPSTGQLAAVTFAGAGTGLTGTAAGLSIGGNAATATNATTAGNATNLGGVAASGYARSGPNTDITSLGALTSINGGPLAGLRNAIINGNFGVNQRAYVSGAAVGAGLYGHDRWKMAASGDTYTFSTTANVTTVTIPASKVLQQVIEGLNLETGTYTLSWTGTAQGKIGAGSYGASGITGAITGGTDTTIEFGPGTVSKVQLEVGSVATVFEQRFYQQELLLCQRYYQVNYEIIIGNATAGMMSFMKTVKFAVDMRVSPSRSYSVSASTNCGTPYTWYGSGRAVFFPEVQSVAAGYVRCQFDYMLSAEL